MEIKRNIILKILLLLSIIFSSGNNACPDSANKTYILEQESGSSNSENNLSAHSDFSDEDLTDLTHKALLPELSECQKSGLNSLLLPNENTDPVWQPPKSL